MPVIELPEGNVAGVNPILGFIVQLPEALAVNVNGLPTQNKLPPAIVYGGLIVTCIVPVPLHFVLGFL